MKYVLIWIAMNGAGGMTSGGAEFDDKAACVRAGDEMRRSLRLAHERLAGSTASGAAHEFECNPKATVKPQ